jgi:hypothetical protein
MAQEYPSQDQYPTVASSENFEIWEDKTEDMIILAFNVNGVTIAVEKSDFDEFARVVAEGQKAFRSGGAKLS